MPDLNRRQLLRYGVASALLATGVVGAESIADPGSATAQESAATIARTRPPVRDPRDFDTTYRGKKIKGVHDKATKKHRVTVDGRKLAVMEIELPVAPDAPGTVTAVLSAMTHYEPFLLDEGTNRDGLLKMTRKAVDTLGDDELSNLAGEEHNHGS